MRTLRIDFTAGTPLPEGNFAGRTGEHNATELIITPPEEMTQCEGITKYVVAFMTEGKLIRTDFYPKTESFTVPLFSQLTRDHCLGLQIEGYDDDGNLLVKSPVVDNIRLEPSANGEGNIETDTENGSLVADVILNTQSRHDHGNKNLLDSISSETFDEISKNSQQRHEHANRHNLDALSDDHFVIMYLNQKARHEHSNADNLEKVSEDEDGSLIYNGNRYTTHEHSNADYLEKVSEDEDGSLIYNGNRYVKEKKTKTIELSIAEEQVGVLIENMMLFFYINLDYYTYSNTESPIKLGDKIVKVEFKTDIPEYPEWVDVTKLFPYDMYSPCNTYMDEPFVYDYEGSLYFLIMDFYTGKSNKFHTDAWLGVLDRLKITVLDESEN